MGYLGHIRPVGDVTILLLLLHVNLAQFKSAPYLDKWLMVGFLSHLERVCGIISGMLKGFVWKLWK